MPQKTLKFRISSTRRLLVMLWLSIAGFAACERHSSEQIMAEGLKRTCIEALAADSVPLTFFACADGKADTDGIYIVVGIRNISPIPHQARIHLDPGAGLSIWITGPDGKPREQQTYWEYDPISHQSPLPWHQYLLPRGGVMGRVINLACDGPSHAQIATGCDSLFAFDLAGVYTIRLSSDATYWCPRGHCIPGESEVSETLVHFAPIEIKLNR